MLRVSFLSNQREHIDIRSSFRRITQDYLRMTILLHIGYVPRDVFLSEDGCFRGLTSHSGALDRSSSTCFAQLDDTIGLNITTNCSLCVPAESLNTQLWRCGGTHGVSR